MKTEIYYEVTIDSYVGSRIEKAPTLKIAMDKIKNLPSFEYRVKIDKIVKTTIKIINEHI